MPTPTGKPTGGGDLASTGLAQNELAFWMFALAGALIIGVTLKEISLHSGRRRH